MLAHKFLNSIVGINLMPMFFVLNLAVRSGDYYLFEDLDEKVELDLLHERPSAGIDDAMTDRKLSDKMTIEQVKFYKSREKK